MAKKSVVKKNIGANGNGTVMKKDASALPVTGYESQVAMLVEKSATLDWLKKEVDFQKETFRTAAAELIETAPAGIKSLEFVEPKGGKVRVSMPDPMKGGNRAGLTGEMIASMEGAGIDTAGMIETSKVYFLEGDWIPWLEGVVADWQAKGIALPEGLSCKETRKLTAEGVAALQELKKATEGEAVAAAKDALKLSVKSATVKIIKP